MLIHTDLSEAFKRPDQVRILDLKHQGLTEIPIEIFQLSNLTELRLGYNQIKVISPEIGQLTNLTRLRLGNNQVSVIPTEIEQLTNLTILSLVNNQVKVVPSQLSQLTNLTKLRLSGNQIEVVPAALSQLTKLEILDLADNQIKLIPTEIGQLTSLTELKLAGNQFLVVPTEIGQLTNLKLLDLSFNLIDRIPIHIGNLSNLISLSLKSNRLTNLPNQINRLSKLQYLNLYQNRFAQFPEIITHLSNLKQLHLDNNQIWFLPPSLKNLVQLEQLWLGSNFLQELPSELGQLKSLTHLHLGRNRISQLPTAIENLKDLVTLNLNNNRLTEIPTQILDLPQLITLDLSKNRNSGIESDFGTLLTYQQRMMQTAEQAEKIKIKDQFLSQMSHELKTPIHGVMGSINLIDEHKLDGQQLQHLQRAKTSAQYLLNMVNEILQFAELEKGQITYQKLPFNLIEICQQVLEIVLPLSQQKNLDLNLNYRSTFPVGWVGDQHKIRQVLINLLGNAIKFTHQGEISLGLQQTSQGVRIEVADSGIGIEEDQTKLIFEPFTQGSSGINRRFSGTGLGLTISQQFIVGMEGEIGVESQTGQGSIFWVELPLPTVNLKPETEVKDAELDDYVRKIVLVVDDEIINREIVSAYFQYWGFEVHQAEDGQDCLNQFEISKYDLIIMDLQMPELDGFETTEQIRQRERESTHQCIPILGLSASVIGDVWSKCESVGMNGYLSKPFETDELKQKVRQLLTD